MKYYSEMLKRLYDTEKELIEAEGAAKKAELEKLRKAKEAELEKIRKEKELKEARATRAKEVEAAFKAADTARAKANQLLKDFTKDYGSFHMTYSSDNTEAFDPTDTFKTFSDLISAFLG